MTVQHAHVGEAGQAIVGNVNAPTEGVGVRKKPEVQPHALAYAPGVEMPRQIGAERATVPPRQPCGSKVCPGCMGPLAGLPRATATPGSTALTRPRRSP